VNAPRLLPTRRRVAAHAVPTDGQELASLSRLLRRPGVASIAISSALARMPFSMGAVALVIFVHSRTGSFGSSGVVTAAYSFSFAAAGPVLGRLVDRRGSRLVLLPSAMAAALAMFAIIALGEAGAPVAALVAAAVLAGVATPPVSGVLRQSWPGLVEPAELPVAYLFDSVLIEIVFVSGQLLTGLLAATIDPAAPLVFAASVGLVGACWFAWLPEVRGMVATGIPIGFTFGALDVALPAFGADHGSSAMGGLFTALLGIGSVIGALVYGLYGSRLGDLRQANVRLAIAHPVLSLPLLLAPSPIFMVAPALLAGLYAAPILTVRSRIAQIAMPPGTGTETFTWLLLAVMVGVSLGSLVAGPLVEASGWRLGVVAGIAVPAVALPLLLVRQRILPAD
jgi:MFS family permease